MALTQNKGDCYYFFRFKYLSNLTKNKNHFRLGRECAICLSSIFRVKNCWITKCGHAFHKKCLREWIYHSLKTSESSCPECRGEMGCCEYLDGINFVVQPYIQNFCDLIEEVDNLLPQLCFSCHQNLGMNFKHCDECKHFIDHGYSN
jgi:hypothetical protein